MKQLALILLLAQTTFAQYINTRDLDSESRRVQRLLGQLDAINAQNTSSSNPSTQLAMLTLLTSGLAITAASSSTTVIQQSTFPANDLRPVHRPLPTRPYPTRPSTTTHVYTTTDPVGTAVGSTIAAAGLIGLIASSANEEQARSQERKIQKEINSIISNLVVTDIDYQKDKANMEAKIATSLKRNIDTIKEESQAQIEKINQESYVLEDNFNNKTNTMTVGFNKIEQEKIAQIQDNLSRIATSDNKTIEKELLKLNKQLSKDIASQKKSLDKNLKTAIKDYKTQQKNSLRTKETRIQNIKYEQQQLLNEVSKNVQRQFAELFQDFTKQYITKLSAY